MLRPVDWDPAFLERSPMFEPLRAYAGAFGAGWPRLADLQRLLDRCDPPVCTASGRPLRLVPQGRRARALEEKHEARVYLRGQLQVRERNWHDLFNVLVWLAFPRTKAALNARHYRALEQQRSSNRGPAQDTLTLFDEGGAIVASCDDRLLNLIHDFGWKELFWRHRDKVRSTMRFLLFGHAMYEKALRPFIGITSRGILLKVEPELLALQTQEQLAMLDARVAGHLADAGRLISTRELAVVPILGVPGWCAGNDAESFYDNTDYFRTDRRPTKARFVICDS